MGSDNLLAFCCGWLISSNMAGGKAQRSYAEGRYDEARLNNNRRYYRYASKYQSAKGTAGHGAHGATHDPAPMPLLRMSRD